MWHNIEVVTNWVAVGAAIATIAGWLPPLAAGMSVVWLTMQAISWIVNKGWIRKP